MELTSTPVWCFLRMPRPCHSELSDSMLGGWTKLSKRISFFMLKKSVSLLWTRNNLCVICCKTLLLVESLHHEVGVKSGP